MNFQTLLKKETLEFIYEEKDPNHMFNSFQFNFLNIFQSSVGWHKLSWNNNTALQQLIGLISVALLHSEYFL